MTAPAQFGRVAWAYRWVEYLCFGPMLERCRTLRLPEMVHAADALVLGDGDGRFLARLVDAAPQMAITTVDASSAMLRRARRRLPAHARVTLQLADALEYVPQSVHALIVSHFFLDCFSDADIALLLLHLRPAVRPGTVWIVSEFAIPPGPITRQIARVVVGTLYLGFRLLTGLRTRRLPDYAAAMRGAGWQREAHAPLLGGLLVSERWRFTNVR